MSHINPDKVINAQPWMQIYGQAIWHSEAEICGNRVALEALRNAIDNVLQWGKDSDAEALSSDGEGYQIHVRLRSYEALGKMRSHYNDSMANPEIRKYEAGLEREISLLKTKIYQLKNGEPFSVSL